MKTTVVINGTRFMPPYCNSEDVRYILQIKSAEHYLFTYYPNKPLHDPTMDIAIWHIKNIGVPFPLRVAWRQAAEHINKRFTK